MQIVEQILQKLNVPYEECKGGKELRFKCINPSHPDRNASANINSDTGLWHCFACQKSGNLKSFIRIVSGDDIEIEKLLTPADMIKMKINAAYSSSIKNILSYENDIDFRRIFESESNNFVPAQTNKHAMRYLSGKRNLTVETIKKFGLLYAVDGYYENRIIIPYRDGETIIGMNSRYIGECDASKRYRYLINEKRFDSYLYNIENIVSKRYAIIVEGPFDLMYMTQCGYNNCISTLNTRISSAHMIKLFQFRQIIFCFDNDERTQAGDNAVKKHTKTILSYAPEFPVMMVKLPVGKDPNACSIDELKTSFKKMKRIKMKEKSAS